MDESTWLRQEGWEYLPMSYIDVVIKKILDWWKNPSVQLRFAAWNSMDVDNVW